MKKMEKSTDYIGENPWREAVNDKYSVAWMCQNAEGGMLWHMFSLQTHIRMAVAQELVVCAKTVDRRGCEAEKVKEVPSKT